MGTINKKKDWASLRYSPFIAEPKATPVEFPRGCVLIETATKLIIYRVGGNNRDNRRIFKLTEQLTASG